MSLIVRRIRSNGLIKYISIDSLKKKKILSGSHGIIETA